MTYKVTYWDEELKQQSTRDATPDEVIEIEIRKSVAAIPKVPETVTPRQIRQALTAAGLRTQIESAVSASSQDVKDWWEFATEFERNHPMVIGMAAGLEIDPLDVDNLFILAGSL